MTLLTTREVAELLRYKPGYIRELVMKRKIPYIKLGRSVRFDKEDIEKLIKDNYVEKSTP
ncbi:MAG: DNA-binding protein [Spirochaetia bacterium]|nr:DNA-binding protein [Spirochaetia bacterium]